VQDSSTFSALRVQSTDDVYAVTATHRPHSGVADFRESTRGSTSGSDDVLRTIYLDRLTLKPLQTNTERNERCHFLLCDNAARTQGREGCEGVKESS